MEARHGRHHDDDFDDDEGYHRHHGQSHSLAGLGAGAAITLIRSDSMDMKLTATYDLLHVGGETYREAVGDVEPMGERLHRQSLGLAFTFHPDHATIFDEPTHVYVGYRPWGCWGCGDLGAALLQGGALLGRVASDGLVRALLGMQ